MVVNLLQKAEEATKRKKKIEKVTEALVAKGEASLRIDDTRGACEHFLNAVEHENDVPCKATSAARKHLDVLEEKGRVLLDKAREAISKQDFARANRWIAEAQDRYPLPGVKDEAKKTKDELSAAEAEQK
jgi:hypothetical protein